MDSFSILVALVVSLLGVDSGYGLGKNLASDQEVTILQGHGRGVLAIPSPFRYCGSMDAIPFPFNIVGTGRNFFMF